MLRRRKEGPNLRCRCAILIASGVINKRALASTIVGELAYFLEERLPRSGHVAPVSPLLELAPISNDVVAVEEKVGRHVCPSHQSRTPDPFSTSFLDRKPRTPLPLPFVLLRRKFSKRGMRKPTAKSNKASSRAANSTTVN